MDNQPTILDRAVKISIIGGVLIVALSIAYYLVVFLPQKENNRIAEQQKQEQQDGKIEQLKTQELKDQQKREYISKRKNDCLQVYKTEDGKWNNVESYEYDEKYDICFVLYKDQGGTNPARCKNLMSDLSKFYDKEGGIPPYGMSAQDFMNGEWAACLNGTTRKKF